MWLLGLRNSSGDLIKTSSVATHLLILRNNQPQVFTALGDEEGEEEKMFLFIFLVFLFSFWVESIPVRQKWRFAAQGNLNGLFCVELM